MRVGCCSDVQIRLAVTVLTLKKALEVMQSVLDDRRFLTGKNCSDGVLAMGLREMPFAGNCSIDIDMLVGGSLGRVGEDKGQ